MAATTKRDATFEQAPTSPVARLVIPVRVFGVNAEGRDFSEDTYAMLDGPRLARIGLSQRVIVGEAIFVLNLLSNREAELTVLELLSLPERDAEVLEWAVRCTQPIKKVWGHTEPNLPA
ncbi:MAG TPA: hypothetical protein VIH17_01060 [Candidatus Acidoferrales bacterium]